MTDFDHILNWKLLQGSHEFPGPDGGTCINEAAIIAAGFEYRAVSTWADCPPCFSPVISAYAIALNDCMPDELRQKLLLPFVIKLSGTADSLTVEVNRAKYIIKEVSKRIVRPYSVSIEADTACAAAYAAALAADCAADCAAAYAAALAADALADAAYAAARAARAAGLISVAVEILNEAILLGNHQEIGIPTAVSRLESAKELAHV